MAHNLTQDGEGEMNDNKDLLVSFLVDLRDVIYKMRTHSNRINKVLEKQASESILFQETMIKNTSTYHISPPFRDELIRNFDVQIDLITQLAEAITDLGTDEIEMGTMINGYTLARS